MNSSDLRALIGRAIHHGGTLVPKVPVRVELAQALAQIGELAITPLSSIALDEKEGASHDVQQSRRWPCCQSIGFRSRRFSSRR